MPPNLSSDEETIETILAAIEKAGYQPGRDFMLAMDAASSEWKSPKGKGFYKLPKAEHRVHFQRADRTLEEPGGEVPHHLH